TGLLFQAAINRKNLPKRPFSSSPLADARCAGRLYTLPERDETARDESAPPHPQAGTLVGHPGENSLPQTEPRWSVFQPGQSSPARTSRAQTPRPSGYGSAVRESAAGAWLPLPSQKPFIRFKIVFQQIRMAVCAPHFEIIGTGPFGFALDLMPTVEDFLHLDGLFFPAEATRRLVGLGSGVTFNLDRGELHLRVFRQGFAPGLRWRGILRVCNRSGAGISFAIRCRPRLQRPWAGHHPRRLRCRGPGRFQRQAPGPDWLWRRKSGRPPAPS